MKKKDIEEVIEVYIEFRTARNIITISTKDRKEIELINVISKIIYKYQNNG